MQDLNKEKISDSRYLHYYKDMDGDLLWGFRETNKEPINAKELFYTLKNVQVDCSELTEEQIKEIGDVFEKSGFNLTLNGTTDEHFYLRLAKFGESVDFFRLDENKNTITYDKFMELFNNKSDLNRWYKNGNFFMYHNFETDEKYGFCHNGFWVKGDLKASEGYVDNCTLATKEEVEERLKEEAIKRGFVVGAEIDCLSYKGYNREVLREDYYLNESDEEVLWNEFCLDVSLIMKDGVWLESPVKQISSETSVVIEHIKAHEKLGDLLREEITKPNLEEVSSIFSSREKGSKKQSLKFKKTLKYLLKKDIILTPKQYKKLWKK